MSDYRVIDGDGHVIEPFEIWQEYLDPGMREFAYRLVVEDGVEKVAMGDLAIEMDVALGDFATPGGLRAGNARDRGWDEIHRGAFEPAARLELMDEMGIDVSVLYPTFVLTAQMLPDGLRDAVVDAWERWMVDFCAVDPSRLKWVAFAPRNDIAAAVSMVERAAGRGAAGVFVSSAPTPDGRLVGEPAEDPLAAAVNATGLPFAIHVSDSGTSTHDFNRFFRTRWMWDVWAGPSEIMLAMIHVFGNGLLDRHPDLRVGFLEGNVGWFRWLIHKLEESYENFGSVVEMPDQSPLEQFRDRCWLSGETGEDEMADVARLIGPDRCIFASDFPHYEATWKPVEELTDRADLTQAEKQAMLWDASVSFYGFDAANLGERVR